MKYTLIFLLSFTTFAKISWEIEVEVIHEKSKIYKYQPDDKKFKIELDKSPYECSLEPTREDHENSRTYISRRLICYNAKDKSSIELPVSCEYLTKDISNHVSNFNVIFLNGTDAKLSNRILITCKQN